MPQTESKIRFIGFKDQMNDLLFDPLTCPQCGSEMRIISLIQDPDVIRRILEHLGLWRQDTGSRCKKPKPDHGPVVHEDFDDGWPRH